MIDHAPREKCMACIGVESGCQLVPEALRDSGMPSGPDIAAMACASGAPPDACSCASWVWAAATVNERAKSAFAVTIRAAFLMILLHDEEHHCMRFSRLGASARPVDLLPRRYPEA